ncbi:MAG: glycosyltransferase family 4 protein [Candidatus Aminicenantia bacterium]
MEKYKITIVVQRYGREIVGGSEVHAREVAEKLTSFGEVEVLTSCALDYTSWENFYLEGEEEIEGVKVKRFYVEGERRKDFNQLSERLFGKPISLKDEIDWIYAQGPVVPGILKEISKIRNERDVFIFFTYLYYPTVFGLKLVPDKSLFVPTAHDEPPIYFNIFKPLFHSPRGFLYNTEEERNFIHKLFNNQYIPNEIAGVGVEIPIDVRPERFKEKFAIDGKYLLYMGRIVSSKGCAEMIEFFRYFRKIYGGDVSLVLLGKTEMEIPQEEGIIYGGFVEDKDKFDAIAGSSAIIVPSRFESLSMIALEGWAMGKPVITTEFSYVVKGMCERSNGGLYYRDREEFAEVINLLIKNEELARRLGENGKKFVENTYTWDRIIEKYLKMIKLVVREKWF